MRQGEMSFDDRVEAGLVVCGTLEMAIEQIKQFQKELGMVHMGLH